MFRRFRIKTALRGEVIRLRGPVDPGALIRAELLFFEPAFLIAPMMRRQGWTARQAMVFMVTDVVRDAVDNGSLQDFARDDPAAYEALRVLHAHILAIARADPALSPCISGPAPDLPPPQPE